MKGANFMSANTDLISNMRAGNRLALARLISKVENRDAKLSELIEKLYPNTGKAQVWGITGPPGAGKSTRTPAATGCWRTAARESLFMRTASKVAPAGSTKGTSCLRQFHSRNEKECTIRPSGSREVVKAADASLKKVSDAEAEKAKTAKVVDALPPGLLPRQLAIGIGVLIGVITLLASFLSVRAAASRRWRRSPCR